MEDIQALSLQCLGEECNYKVSIFPDKFERIPPNCEQCGKRWLPEGVSGYIDKKVSPLVNLGKSI